MRRVRVFIAIAVALAAVGLTACGKSKHIGGATVTTAGDGRTTTQPAGRAATTAPGGAGTTTTKPVAAPQPASSAAALAALREFATAIGQENFDRVGAVTSGAMAALVTVEDINLVYSRQHGAPSLAVSSAPSGLAISSQSGDSAVGKGHVSRVVRIADQQSTETFDGPFQLARAGGVWRVTDATYDGASLVVRDVRATAQSGGVGVILVSILDFGRSTAALITMRNIDGKTDVVNIDGATITRGGTDADEAGSKVVATTSDVEDGYAGFLRSSGNVTRLVVKLSRAGQPVEVTFAL